MIDYLLSEAEFKEQIKSKIVGMLIKSAHRELDEKRLETSLAIYNRILTDNDLFAVLSKHVPQLFAVATYTGRIDIVKLFLEMEKTLDILKTDNNYLQAIRYAHNEAKKIIFPVFETFVRPENYYDFLMQAILTRNEDVLLIYRSVILDSNSISNEQLSNCFLAAVKNGLRDPIIFYRDSFSKQVKKEAYYWAVRGSMLSLVEILERLP